jgi:hypothetical protein
LEKEKACNFQLPYNQEINKTCRLKNEKRPVRCPTEKRLLM